MSYTMKSTSSARRCLGMALTLAAFFGLASAWEEAETDQTTTPLVGLVGFGIDMYKPLCATSCHNFFSRPELACSVPNEHGGHGMRHSPASGRPAELFITHPWCHATDESYLTSLAYCFDVYCGSEGDAVPNWELEKFWSKKAAAGVMEPKWSYREAVAHAREILGDEKPRVWNFGVMNYTAAVNQSRYDSAYGSFDTAEYAEVMHARYGLVTLIAGAGIPIVLTLTIYLPYMSTLTSRITPYLTSSVFKDYNSRILPYWLGNAATIGEALYIFAFVSLNIVVSAIDYRTHWPHRMYRSSYVELMFHIANRTGIIAFAIAPLVILLASRNNILLWLSNWSHGTFLVLHRWVGRIFILQAVIHSIVELHLFIHLGRYPNEESKPYWIWGVLATVCAVAILFFGVTWARRTHYELFLITHIILVVFVLAGSWYHVQLLYFGERGFENWLYACFAVWAADRLLRVLWLCKTGVKTSRITALSDDLVRIDIEGVRWPDHPGSHAYAYFPGLSWRVWENHPFSIVPTSLIRRAQKAKATTSADSASSSGKSSDSQAEKGVGVTVRPAQDVGHMATTAGMTLYVKKFRGMTRNLKQAEKMTTLLEGPYSDRSHDELMLSDRLVCIAGGVGITGVLSFAAAHPNAKLYWSMRNSDAALAEDLASVTDSLDESEVRVGQRFGVRDVLEHESAGGYEKVGVVVCGPGALCDDVRATVSRMGRQRGDVVYKLSVEAFAW